MYMSAFVPKEENQSVLIISLMMKGHSFKFINGKLQSPLSFTRLRYYKDLTKIAIEKNYTPTEIIQWSKRHGYSKNQIKANRTRDC